MSASLVELLGIRPGDLVAVVGGGGKSTIVLTLGVELTRAMRPVVITTTTKMGADQIPAWSQVCDSVADVALAVEQGWPAFFLASVAQHKVMGVAPSLVEDAWAATGATTLVEADGARRKSFKAPSAGEPVIPRATTLVVVTAGLDAIGQTIGASAHRPEIVASLLDRDLDDTVRAVDIATVLAHPDGGLARIPATARVAVALTKGTPDQVGAVASHLATADRVERTIAVPHSAR